MKTPTTTHTLIIHFADKSDVVYTDYLGFELVRQEEATQVPKPTQEPEPTPTRFSYLAGGMVYDDRISEPRWFPVNWGQTIPEQPALTEAQLNKAATTMKVSQQHLWALLKVESNGRGFLLAEPAPTRPKILFEARHFYRLTPKPVSKTRRDLACPTWREAHTYYKGGSAEWDRLRDAAEFDMPNALKSCSWGLGQIMGFNYKLAGCDTLEQFVEECFTSEYNQLMHMVGYLTHAADDGLRALQIGDWRRVANLYNGPGAIDTYATKLAQAARTEIEL